MTFSEHLRKDLQVSLLLWGRMWS